MATETTTRDSETPQERRDREAGRRRRRRKRAQGAHDALPRRPGDSKLTPDRRAAISAALEAGLTREEAAQVAGISPRTFYRWQSLAEQCRGLAPADWRRRTVEELRGIAAELGLSESDIRGSGKGDRVIKDNWVAAIDELAGAYIDFFHDLQRVRPRAQLTLVSELQAIARGGRMVRDQETGELRWEPEVLVDVTEEEILDKDGNVVGFKRRTKRRQVGKSETAIKWLAERGFRKNWGRTVPLDPDREVADPEQRANEVVEALRRMEGTVPAPAEEGAGDGGD